MFMNQNRDVLERVLRSFSEVTGLRAHIVDGKGELRMSTPGMGWPQYCEIVRSTKTGRTKCSGCYLRAGAQAFQVGEPYIFRCHAGLILWAAAMTHNARHVATIICGQVLMWEPEEFFWVEVGKMTRGLGVSLARLVEAARKLPVVSPRKVQAAADLLFVVAGFLMTTGMTLVEQNREMAKHQARLGEIMKRKARLEGDNREAIDSAPVIPLPKEQDLVKKAVSGDRLGSWAILDEIVADILSSDIDIRHLKSRFIELIVVMSRAAATAGAEIGGLLETNYRYMERILGTEDLREIAYHASTAVRTIIEQVQRDPEGNPGAAGAPVAKALRYLERNYRSTVRLEDVAEAVHVSPFYLSHMFKEKTGFTVLEYVTKLRVEKSKELLAYSDLSVAEVAGRVGYAKPGYFARVFKKWEGVTPSEYRCGASSCRAGSGKASD